MYGSIEKPRKNIVLVRYDPSASTRQVTSNFYRPNVNQIKVVRILRANGFKPFKMNVSQKILPADPERRLNETMWSVNSEIITYSIGKMSIFGLLKTQKAIGRSETKLDSVLMFWTGLYQDRILGIIFFRGI